MSGSAAPAVVFLPRSVTTSAYQEISGGHRTLERITARRAELDVLAEKLAEQLEQVQAEHEELLVTKRVLRRLHEQAAAEALTAPTASVTASVAGRAVLLVPHRSDAAGEDAVPRDYQKMLAIVRKAGGRATRASRRRSARSSSRARTSAR